MDHNPEAQLRKIWTAAGVSVEQQDALIAAIVAKAQPGTMVGPFRIPEQIQLDLPFPP